MAWKTFILFLGISRNVLGSIIEINETLFSSLPPLYALDDWSECQQPGDVYCMVDAVLTSKQPSPVLTLLQEYSKQTLKHYNRSLIHRGVCVSRCGAMIDGTWNEAAQTCVNLTLHRYGLEAEVQSVGWCSGTRAVSWLTRALAVLCTSLIAVSCLATALHSVGARCGKPDCNKYLLAFSLKQNWAILTYDRTKPRTDDRMKDVACVEGIRFLGMQCVIFSHVMLIYIYSYIDNPEFVEKMYDQIGWKLVLNSPLWIQAFFSISGFLTAYAVLITADNSPITVLKCIMSIFTRWIRLTPVAVFALWFTMSWFPALGSGPQWEWVVGREASDCSERWWYHLLYVHNHLPTGKFCMGHTWYLAADMQLHIFGVFLMLVLMRYRRCVVPLLAGLISASMLAAGLVVYWQRITPIVTAQAPEVLRTMFLGCRTLTLLYLPMWMNLPGYLGGFATAFLMHHLQTAGVKLNQIKWFNLLYHLSLTLGGCVVFTGAVFLSDGAPPAWAAAVYAAIDRALVAICFNIFMLGSFSHCKSGLLRVVSWRGFHPLGRLSYSVFIIHFIVLRLTVAANTQLLHASILALVSLLITTSVLSYIVSIPVFLLIESPALQVWRAATGSGDRPAPAHPPTPTPHKHIDLIDNLRRQHV